ncbi:N-acetylneuraminate synthase family protein [Candidatus Roizmanbacteria bacterium]|nr:N-acetylneuraminate synthase family protein [Candidatus Roizmanbacteria bacterium]
MNQNKIFEDLFVLEIANNHWGDVNRGLKIISDFSKIVRFNSVRAAIKFQFRDVETLIHKDYHQRVDVRYIKKTLATQLTNNQYATLVEATRKSGCIPMSSPFDERSVDQCVELGIEVIKLASSELNDWFLIEKIAKTKKPVIASTGGSSLKDMDDLVKFFENRNIPLALNHCVSIYPSEDGELELNQIDFLKERYPGHVIGLSTHEYHNWESSMIIAYAKGARTFERHIDIDKDGIPVSPYCSSPQQIDSWFKAYWKAKEMCGGSTEMKRVPPLKEIQYLDETVRGVYVKRDLPIGHIITGDEVYLAIPLLKGQLSSREIMSGEVLIKAVKKDRPLFIDMIDSPYAYNDILKKHIYNRGVDPNPPKHLKASDKLYPWQKGNGQKSRRSAKEHHPPAPAIS